MRWLVLLATLAWTVPAAAQTTKYGSGPTPLGITLVSPTDIDCSTPGNDCAPLNLAACDDAEGAARQFEVTIAPPTPFPITTDARLYVWVQQMQTLSTVGGSTVPNCTFQTGSEIQIPLDNYFSVNTTGPLVSSDFQFPADLSTTLTLTVGDFLGAAGPLAGDGKVVADACSSGVERQYLLCFGLDYAGGQLTQAADGNVTKEENTAWVEVDVDTVPPPNVTSVSATPGDGKVTLAPTAAADIEGEGDDWFAAVRPIDDAAAATESDCRDWTDATKSTRVATTTGKFDLGGLENGKTYEGCVALIDGAGNPSEGFASFVAEPINQCDFAECYPGELKTGCAAVGATPLAAALALLLLARRPRKERA